MTKDPATDSGLNVRLVAAFAGWKGIPWLCWAHSDLSPRLVLHADRVEFRVIRTRSKPYSSISRVDYRKWHYTENIVLEFTDSLTTFIGNTMNPATARQAIRYLQEKGCPLSDVGGGFFWRGGAGGVGWLEARRGAGLGVFDRLAYTNRRMVWIARFQPDSEYLLALDRAGMRSQ
ncbi:hypothetical protein PERCYII40_4177 [Pseudomonas aeruginosa]|nr:hypothetical protein PERCYII40_4177 [Pseudomonas aeruginosa]